MPVMQMTENADTYYFDMVAINHQADPILVKTLLKDMTKRLATKGFVAYIVGTDNFVVSKQWIFTQMPQ